MSAPLGRVIARMGHPFAPTPLGPLLAHAAPATVAMEHIVPVRLPFSCLLFVCLFVFLIFVFLQISMSALWELPIVPLGSLIARTPLDLTHVHAMLAIQAMALFATVRDFVWWL